jgi:3-methyladenine DNA glycosylase AlkC
LLGASVVAQLVDSLALAAPGRPATTVARVASALPGMPLGERARALRDALLADLPGDYVGFAAVVARALADDPAFTGWLIWPVSEAVATLATTSEPPDFEAGIDLLGQLTTRLTGEFALRTFLAADLDRTLAAVGAWTTHDNEHVRRLASEGTRPRLPWARRVPELLSRPDVTVPLLDVLYRDGSEYVRRSVANHLNDLSRADPDLVTSTAKRWLAEPDQHTGAVVRHGLRTLVKAGDATALRLLGFGAPTEIEVGELRVTTPAVPTGGELSFTFTVTNRGVDAATLAIDYVIHHRKANGTLAPKVFKLGVRTLGAGADATITRSHSFRPITTRRYYLGEHAVQVQINGTRYGNREFELGG